MIAVARVWQTDPVSGLLPMSRPWQVLQVCLVMDETP